MAHFAEINDLKKVIRVLVLDNKDTQDADGNEVESIGATYLHDGFGGTWVRTSYNTHGGTHKLGGTPFRKNYCGKGDIYDESKDAFYKPQPFASWTLNETTCLWEPPVARPDYAPDKEYDWNEETTSWDEVVPQS
jgi:hypothetical protein